MRPWISINQPNEEEQDDDDDEAAAESQSVGDGYRVKSNFRGQPASTSKSASLPRATPSSTLSGKAPRVTLRRLNDLVHPELSQDTSVASGKNAMEEMTKDVAKVETINDILEKDEEANEEFAPGMPADEPLYPDSAGDERERLHSFEIKLEAVTLTEPGKQRGN